MRRWLTDAECRALMAETERLAGIVRDPYHEAMRAAYADMPKIVFREADKDPRWEYERVAEVGGFVSYLPIGRVEEIAVAQSVVPIKVLKSYDGRDKRLDAYDSDTHEIVGYHTKDGAPVYQARRTG